MCTTHPKNFSNFIRVHGRAQKHKNVRRSTLKLKFFFLSKFSKSHYKIMIFLIYQKITIFSLHFVYFQVMHDLFLRFVLPISNSISKSQSILFIEGRGFRA